MQPVQIAVRPSVPSLRSFVFDTYNEAQAFFLKSAALNPSKPQRRIRGAGAPVWAVVLVNKAAMKAEPKSRPFMAALSFDMQARIR